VWLYNIVVGIYVAGEIESLITPQFGGSLTHASARYKSVLGEVASHWELKDGKFLLDVTVSCNCPAKEVLPNGETYRVESHRQIFKKKNLSTL